MLTPILAAIAIDNVLTTLEKRTGERTLVWKSADPDTGAHRALGLRLLRPVRRARRRSARSRC